MKFTNGQQKINKVKGIKRSKNMRMEYILIKKDKTKNNNIQVNSYINKIIDKLKVKYKDVDEREM